MYDKCFTINDNLSSSRWSNGTWFFPLTFIYASVCVFDVLMCESFDQWMNAKWNLFFIHSIIQFHLKMIKKICFYFFIHNHFIINCLFVFSILTTQFNHTRKIEKIFYEFILEILDLRKCDNCFSNKFSSRYTSQLYFIDSFIYQNKTQNSMNEWIIFHLGFHSFYQEKKDVFSIQIVMINYYYLLVFYYECILLLMFSTYTFYHFGDKEIIICQHVWL